MTPLTALEPLAESYRDRIGGPGVDRAAQIDVLFKRYFDGRVRPLAEALACGAAVSALCSDGSFDASQLTPQQLEAFSLAFPNLSIEDLGNYSGGSLDGLLNAWKGKLFEVKVRDSLNQGDWVGDLHLEAGQKAVLAESATQPGWDLQILDASGSTAEQIQLKASDFVSYVEQAAARYPDIPIVSTSELAGDFDSTADISTSPIADSDLESELADAVGESLQGSLWESVLPGMPLALNLYWVSKGERTPEQAVRAVSASTAAMATSFAANEVLQDLAVDLIFDATIGFGVGFLARKFFGWLLSGDDEVKRRPESVIDKATLVEKLEQGTERLRLIGCSYPPS